MALELDKMIIGIVLFGLVITVSLGLVADMGDTYNVNVSTGPLNELNETVSETYTLGNEMQEKVFQGEITFANFLSKLWYGSYLALKLVKNTFDIFLDVIRIGVDYLGIPPVFQLALFTIVIIAIIFALIYIFMSIIGGGT